MGAHLGTISGSRARNLQGTDANMIVYNDFVQALAVNIDQNTIMSHTFPRTSTIQTGDSVSGYVEASDWPGQSSFDLHFDQTHSMKVLIGGGLFYTTSVTPSSFPDGTGAALLAPGKPFSTKEDYDFYFFAGPGTIPALIESFSNANLPAIISSIAKNPITINISNTFLSSLKITEAKIDANALSCAYAALTPKSGVDSATYNANIICSLSHGQLDGTITILNQDSSFEVAITDATLFVQAQIDLKMTTKPLITALKCSLGDYTASGSFLNVIGNIPFASALQALGATPYRVAGAINNDLNQQIMDTINADLAKIGSFAQSGLFKRLASALRIMSGRSSDTRNKASQIQNASMWMSTPQIQAKTLSQLKLPGTHDSATYGLTNTLSQIQYDDIAFLWSLSNTAAPVDGSWPIPSKPSAATPIYLGDTLYDFIMERGVKFDAQTQGRSILQQLQDGIRSFDLRVYYDTRDSKFYTQHALRGPALEEILDDIKSFIQANPESQELIFVYISHTNLGSYPDQIPALTALVKKYVSQDHLYWQATPSGQSQFDLQSLKDTTISNITNGAPKVMFLNTDTDYHYADTITNTPGHAGVTWTRNIYSLPDLAANQGPALQNHSQALWSVGWSLDLTNDGLAAGIVNELRTGNYTPGLENIATSVNGALEDFFKQYGTNFNILSVDWEEYSSGSNIVGLVISINNSG